jgi:CXXX repeat modification system protein
MDQKVVWELSEEDSNEIQDLFERKIALENLVKIVDLKDSDIYEKLLKDYGKVRNTNGRAVIGGWISPKIRF